MFFPLHILHYIHNFFFQVLRGDNSGLANDIRKEMKVTWNIHFLFKTLIFLKHFLFSFQLLPVQHSLVIPADPSDIAYVHF